MQAASHSVLMPFLFIQSVQSVHVPHPLKYEITVIRHALEFYK